MNLDSDRLNTMSMRNHKIEDQDTTKTSLSGKLMFAAIIVMFFVMVFILCLHLYARCYLLRRRRHFRARNRSAQLVFYMDAMPNPPAPLRLEPSVLNSLPVFVYSPEKHTHLPECAVCLSEFEENEEGRLLPKCNHGFHIQCIDMWFLSHSTCPLCRSVVEPVEAPEPGSGERRKEQLAIDIPNRGSMENNELGQMSPAFISPVTRFLSFTSMLNMSRRSGGTTPSGVETSSGETSVPEDIESLRRVDDVSPNTQVKPAADFRT